MNFLDENIEITTKHSLDYQDIADIKTASGQAILVDESEFSPTLVAKTNVGEAGVIKTHIVIPPKAYYLIHNDPSLQKYGIKDNQVADVSLEEKRLIELVGRPLIPEDAKKLFTRSIYVRLDNPNVFHELSHSFIHKFENHYTKAYCNGQINRLVESVDYINIFCINVINQINQIHIISEYIKKHINNVQDMQDKIDKIQQVVLQLDFLGIANLSSPIAPKSLSHSNDFFIASMLNFSQKFEMSNSDLQKFFSENNANQQIIQTMVNTVRKTQPFYYDVNDFF